MLRGWALAHQGQAQEGIELIKQGLIAHRATGAELLRSYFLALLADAHGTIGESETGLTVLTEALALVEKTGKRWCDVLFQEREHATRRTPRPCQTDRPPVEPKADI